MAGYHPTNQRPPKANPDLVARISKISTLSRCLEDALSDLIHEEDTINDADTITSDVTTTTKCGDGDGDGDGTNKGQTNKATTERRNKGQTLPPPLTVINEEFKTKVLAKYGEAVASIKWDDEDCHNTTQSKTNNDDDTPKSTTETTDASLSYNSTESMPPNTVIHPPSPTPKRQRGTTNRLPTPPAALLRGTMTYYNRIGGQWRIVVSDGEIRRRVNFLYDAEKTKRTKANSLWEHSGRTDGGDDDSTIKLDGPLLILAYDDLM